jgi:hypothetical protein
MYISGNKQEEQQTIRHQSDKRVWQSSLRLRAFVLVGEDFLFLFKALKGHHNSGKKVTK